MKKTIWIVAAVVILLGIAWWGNSKPNISTTGLIKVGVAESLTGVAAYYGEENRKGVEVALDEISKKYQDLNFEVYHEDSLYTAKGGVDAYQNMKNRHGLDAVITHASAVSLAIQPLAKQDGILQMAVSSSAKTYSSPDDLSFRMSPTSDAEAQVMADFIKSRNYKRLGLIYMNNDFGVSVISSLENELRDNPNVEVIGKEGFVLEATDFRTILAKLRTSNPDSIFVVATASHLNNLLRQAKELGITPQFLGPRSTEDPILLKNSKDVAEGFIYTYGFDANNTTSETRRFVEAYRTAYNSLPDGYAAEGYEGMMLVAASFDKCGKDYGCIQSYLSGLRNYPSIFGRLSFDRNGDVSYPFYLKTVRSGQFMKFEQ